MKEELRTIQDTRKGEAGKQNSRTVSAHLHRLTGGPHSMRRDSRGSAGSLATRPGSYVASTGQRPGSAGRAPAQENRTLGKAGPPTPSL